MAALRNLATAGVLVSEGILATQALAAEVRDAPLVPTYAASLHASFALHQLRIPATVSHSTTSRLFEIVSSMSMSDRERATRTELASYGRLQSDWDGYGGAAPSVEALGDMELFLDALLPGVAIPRITLASSGVPSFYWDERDFFADVEFAGGGECSLYIRAKGGEEQKLLRDFDSPTVAAASLPLELSHLGV